MSQDRLFFANLPDLECLKNNLVYRIFLKIQFYFQLIDPTSSYHLHCYTFIQATISHLGYSDNPQLVFMAFFSPHTPTTFPAIAVKEISFNMQSDHMASLLETCHWLPTSLRVKAKSFSVDVKALHDLGSNFLPGPLTPHSLTLTSLPASGPLYLLSPLTEIYFPIICEHFTLLFKPLT